MKAVGLSDHLEGWLKKILKNLIFKPLFKVVRKMIRNTLFFSSEKGLR